MVRRWMRIIVVLAILTSVWRVSLPAQAAPLLADELPPKHLSGGADELEAMRLPIPQDVGTQSSYALVDVRFTNGFWAGTLAVDSGDLSILLIAPNSQDWSVQLALPNRQETTLAALSEQSGGSHEITSIGLEEEQYPAELYTIYGAPPGEWEIWITLANQQASSDGFLVVAPTSTYGLYTYLTTTHLVEGQPVGFGAYLYTEPLPVEQASKKEDEEKLLLEASSAPPAPLANIITEATIVLSDRDGAKTTLPLLDDSQQTKSAAGDGRVGAVLPALQPGLYQAQIRVKGRLPDGTPIERTSEEIFPILPSSIQLTGYATSQIIDENRIGLGFEIQMQTGAPARFVAYTEVWGTDATGTLIPAGWASGIVAPTPLGRDQTQLMLEFDARWLALAQVTAPLVLRQIRVQDVDTFVPITTADEIPLAEQDLPPVAFLDPQTIDRNDSELRMGRPPAELGKPSSAIPTRTQGGGLFQGSGGSGIRGASVRGASASGAQLLAFQPRAALAGPPGAPVGKPLQQVDNGIFLVHGYCSGALWPEWQFNDGPTVEFRDINQNRSHDTFARLIAQQGNAAFRDWFSIVAHSQGGAAALHLHTFYWSRLENSPAPRPIQTLGTPYLGTPLAGFLAWIGRIFGASCGFNWNLTRLGSLFWLSTINSAPRNQVYFWTTAHRTLSLCHASSLILSGADDGVISVWAGSLPGAHDLGMKRGWCHSTRMVYTAQYLDTDRNDEMDVYGRLPTDDVGVIPATGACPSGRPVLTIYMDDEDRRNANARGGWIGATTSTDNTTFRFCRVQGRLFHALAPTNQVQNHYAVLKLGLNCPSGSVEFGRHFDNEDNNNKNWSAGEIAPNISDRNTTLWFCLFRSDTNTMNAFPDLGMSYGVFGANNFRLALQTGYVHTDDEDSRNANAYMANSAWAADAQRIVTGGSNTDLYMVRVR